MKDEAAIRSQIEECVKRRDFFDWVAFDQKSYASPAEKEQAKLYAHEEQAQIEILIWVLGDYSLHRPRQRFGLPLAT